LSASLPAAPSVGPVGVAPVDVVSLDAPAADAAPAGAVDEVGKAASAEPPAAGNADAWVAERSICIVSVRNE
jgi:hypothetical protein